MVQTKTTPLKAVRKYCLWCMAGQANEVKLCPSTECPLYDLRFNKSKKGLSALKQIKKRCKDCSENVKKCEFEDCSLFLYKTGHNPARKGIGGKGRVSNLKHAVS